jgi:hypothetical protein
MHRWFSILRAAFFWKKNKKNDYAFFNEKHLLILKNLPKAASVIDRFSPVSTPHWMQKKPADLHVIGSIRFKPTGGFRNHLRDTGGFLNVATSFLKRVT